MSVTIGYMYEELWSHICVEYGCNIMKSMIMGEKKVIWGWGFFCVFVFCLGFFGFGGFWVVCFGLFCFLRA